MNRSDYRRAFIMLRAAMPGYGGHVRLERRTLTGSMYFIITAPQGVSELSAALVGRQNGDYCAAPIGPLSRDRRGQLALAWQFDPRNIGGRPLEAYSWVVVAATGGPCAVALTGNVEGSRPVDPDALGRAVCALFSSPAADIPAEDLPEGDAPAPAEDRPAGDQTAPEAESAPEEPPVEEMRGDVRVYTRSRARLRSAARRRAEAARAERTDQGASDGQTAPDGATQRDAVAAAPAEPSGEGASDGQTAPGGTAERDAGTAARRLGLDITSSWPGSAESLRRLFATQAPAEVPLSDGYTYVRSPLPKAAGYGDALAGLRVEDGAIAGLRYALPGVQAAEPPAGLDGYIWRSVGDGSGYWVMDEEIT